MVESTKTSTVRLLFTALTSCSRGPAPRLSLFPIGGSVEKEKDTGGCPTLLPLHNVREDSFSRLFTWPCSTLIPFSNWRQRGNTLHYIHTYMNKYIHTYIHYITLYNITLSYPTLPYITLPLYCMITSATDSSSIHTYIDTYIHYIHYITLHYITLHYITLHYITLHCITLH